MRWTVVLSSRARSDLNEIRSYIANVLLSPVTANRMVDRILTEIENLDKYPYRNPKYKRQTFSGVSIRYFPVGSYLVFYVPFDPEKIVRVMRIIYSGRNIPRHLKPSNFDAGC